MTTNKLPGERVAAVRTRDIRLVGSLARGLVGAILVVIGVLGGIGRWDLAAAVLLYPALAMAVSAVMVHIQVVQRCQERQCVSGLHGRSISGDASTAHRHDRAERGSDRGGSDAKLSQSARQLDPTRPRAGAR